MTVLAGFCLMSNFDSTVYAIRKVSTHLTEEPFSYFSKTLFISSHPIYYQRIDNPSLLHERHTVRHLYIRKPIVATLLKDH